MTAPLIAMPRATLVGDVLAEMYRRDIRNMPVEGDAGPIARLWSPCQRFFNMLERLTSMNRCAAVGRKSPIPSIPEDQYTPG